MIPFSGARATITFLDSAEFGTALADANPGEWDTAIRAHEDRQQARADDVASDTTGNLVMFISKARRLLPSLLRMRTNCATQGDAQPAPDTFQKAIIKHKAAVAKADKQGKSMAVKLLASFPTLYDKPQAPARRRRRPAEQSVVGGTRARVEICFRPSSSSRPRRATRPARHARFSTTLHSLFQKRTSSSLAAIALTWIRVRCAGLKCKYIVACTPSARVHGGPRILA
jgi:hypothetical protein